jgi:hypothetical protein
VFFVFFFLLHFSCTRTGVLSWGLRWAVSELKYSCLYVAELKTVWSHTSTHMYVYMAWCLFKNQGDLSSSPWCCVAISEAVHTSGAVPWMRRDSCKPEYDSSGLLRRVVCRELADVSEVLTAYWWKWWAALKRLPVFCEITRHSNPENCHLHTRRRENLKYHLVGLLPTFKRWHKTRTHSQSTSQCLSGPGPCVTSGIWAE